MLLFDCILFVHWSHAIVHCSMALFTIQWHAVCAGTTKASGGLVTTTSCPKAVPFSKLFFECNHFLQSTAANAHGSFLPKKPEACPVNIIPICVCGSHWYGSEQTYLAVVIHTSTVYAPYQSYACLSLKIRFVRQSCCIQTYYSLVPIYFLVTDTCDNCCIALHM